jgi:transcriptional regulator with XRE-family HTH domain
MLREWRTARGLSQLALGAEAAVSTRHLSFVETGRAEPSRELLMKLAAVLGMPPRDRNALLSAAGYQPIYRETPPGSPEMKDLLHAVALILRQHDPFGAVAVDRDFSMVMCNRGFAMFLQLLGVPGVPPPFTALDPPGINLVDALFDPAMGLRGGHHQLGTGGLQRVVARALRTAGHA